MKQLFTLSALVDDFKGCDQVFFCFFVTKRQGTLPPYEQIIKDYDPKDEHVEYGKGYIDEMFTLEEAAQAYQYLKKTYGTEATITAYDLPVEAMNMMPTGAIPVGGPTDMIFLNELEVYNLPFDMWAYYDLRFAQEPKNNKEINTMKDTVVFELVETNYLTRWPCHICGGNTEKEPVLCEVLDGPNKGLRICESCLEDGDFDTSLKMFAEMLERHARETRALIGRIEAPSFEDWKAKIQGHVEQYNSQETANKCSCPDCPRSEANPF